MAMVLIVLIVLAASYKLGLFNSVVELSKVAERESTAYNREHKSRVAKRYASIDTEVDVEAVNAAIAKIDQLAFD